MFRALKLPAMPAFLQHAGLLVRISPRLVRGFLLVGCRRITDEVHAANDAPPQVLGTLWPPKRRPWLPESGAKVSQSVRWSSRRQYATSGWSCLRRSKRRRGHPKPRSADGQSVDCVYDDGVHTGVVDLDDIQGVLYLVTPWNKFSLRCCLGCLQSASGRLSWIELLDPGQDGLA